MKKILPALFLTLFTAVMALGQTLTVHIYGQVTTGANNTPWANHAVYITSDSTYPPYMSYYNVVYTNPNGLYEDNVVVPGNSQIIFHVTTEDCNGVMHTGQGVSTNTPININFNLCNTAPPPCNANFSWYPDSTNLNTIHFVNNSTGSGLSCLWSFGNGTSSTSFDPHCMYNQAGTYTVCLVISNTSGCSDTVCHVITVGNPPPPCQASFIATVDSNAILTWHFLSTSTGSPTNYLWYFGDGTSSSSVDPHHSYSQPGSYNVCLTISGANCQSSFCDTIVVGSNPSACSNYITFSCQLLFFHFEGHASGGTAPYSYQWSFGDGTNSSLQSPTHTYAQAGTYTVILITFDANGCAYTTTLTVTASTTASTYDVNGTVFAGNDHLDAGHVVLYSANGSNAYSIVATASVDTNGFYHFGGIPAGTYYIKAFPAPSSSYYNNYLPTYYPHNTLWAYATAVILGPAANPYNIYLEHVIMPAAGGCSILGTATQGSKSTFSGVPAANVEILLQSDAGTSYISSFTDSQGNYSFANLGFGTYKIYAEVAGLTTYPAVVSLSAANPSINNVNVMITSTGVYSSVMDITGNDHTQFGLLYPNPAVNQASIVIVLARAQQLDFSMYDLLGQKVYSSSKSLVKGSQTVEFNTAGLKPGTYHVQIVSPDGSLVIRKFNILR